MSQARTLIFEILREGQVAQTVKLSQDVIKIGSHPKSHLFLEDKSVASVHAVIEVKGEDVFLIDLGSGRGTLVNGQRANKQRLGHRDRLMLGQVEIVFSLWDESAAAAAEGGEEEEARPRIPDEVVYARRFLSRPASTDGAVEIAMLYRDFVLADEIYKPPRNITVGPAETNDFVVESGRIPGDSFVLVEAGGGDVQLRFTSTMDGELYVGSERYSLADAIERGVAKRSGDAYALPLAEATRARLIVDDLMFFVHRSTKPKLIIPFQFREGTALVYLAASFVLHALFLAMLKFLPVGMSDFRADQIDQKDRFVQLLLQEKAEEAPEKPEWLKEKEEEQQEDDGAAGDEGRAGDERAEDTKNRAAVEGDKAPGESIELARAEARTEALNSGALVVLNQYGPASLFGNTANGYDDVMAIGAVGEDGPIGASYGTGGLGRYGGGLSAGGTNTGGGGFGYGGGFAVRGRTSGDGQVGRQLRTVQERQVRTPEVKVLDPEIRGQLDMETIRRVIREKRREIKACYEAELQRTPTLAGRVVVAFVIAPDGAVARVDVKETELKNAGVENCMKGRIKYWRFPEPRGGGVVNVSYPFVFDPGSE